MEAVHQSFKTIIKLTYTTFYQTTFSIHSAHCILPSFDSFASLRAFGRDAHHDMCNQASGVCVVFFLPRSNTHTLHNPGTTATALHSTLQIHTALWED